MADHHKKGDTEAEKPREINWDLPSPKHELEPEPAPIDESAWSLPQVIANLNAANRRATALEEKCRELESQLDPKEVRQARAQILRELVALVPKAIKDARTGKPALLRLIVRTIRLK
jgi:hypothetical protein